MVQTDMHSAENRELEMKKNRCSTKWDLMLHLFVDLLASRNWHSADASPKSAMCKENSAK